MKKYAINSATAGPFWTIFRILKAKNIKIFFWKKYLKKKCLKNIFLKNIFLKIQFFLFFVTHHRLILTVRRGRINRIFFHIQKLIFNKIDVIRAMSRWIAMWSITTKCGIVVFPREKWFFDVDRHAKSWCSEIVVTNEKIERTKKHSDH